MQDILNNIPFFVAGFAAFYQLAVIEEYHRQMTAAKIAPVPAPVFSISLIACVLSWAFVVPIGLSCASALPACFDLRFASMLAVMPVLCAFVSAYLLPHAEAEKKPVVAE